MSSRRWRGGRHDHHTFLLPAASGVCIDASADRDGIQTCGVDMRKCEHGLTTMECLVCASPKRGAKIIPFTGITTLDLPPDQILEAAVGKMEGVVIMGWDAQGEEYFASSYADGGTVLWLLERLKKQLLEVAK